MACYVALAVTKTSNTNQTRGTMVCDSWQFIFSTLAACERYFASWAKQGCLLLLRHQLVASSECLPALRGNKCPKIRDGLSIYTIQKETRIIT
eukprot:5007420-Amphidinium_carterae.1